MFNLHDKIINKFTNKEHIIIKVESVKNYSSIIPVFTLDDSARWKSDQLGQCHVPYTESGLPNKFNR